MNSQERLTLDRPQVVVNEVGPRDGLQSQSRILSIEERVALIDSLLAAGVRDIEAGAFVSPKAVPAMAGTAAVLEQIDLGAARFSVLVPNVYGYELARDAGAECVAMVAYATERMATENAKMSREQALKATETMLAKSEVDGLKVIVTIVVAFECPFEGVVEHDIVVRTCDRLFNAGASLVVLADTIGAANPATVEALLERLLGQFDSAHVACHFHDTRALALANVYAALNCGIRRFDASIAGLGGCPFAPGAKGNVATEDIVMMLQAMGFETGINLRKLIDASDFAEEATGSARGGRSKSWLKPHLLKHTAS